MSAKKIKKSKKRGFVPDTGRVNRALEAIAANSVSSDMPPGAAPVPIWELTKPLSGPENPNGFVPAIRPELVDPVIILTDPYVVADFETTGMRMARMQDPDEEKVLLYLIDTSRDLDARKVDTEFAIDMGPELNNRTMGTTLASLAKKGRARVVATRDARKVIIQMIFRPEDSESPEGKYWLEYWGNRKLQ